MRRISTVLLSGGAIAAWTICVFAIAAFVLGALGMDVHWSGSRHVQAQTIEGAGQTTRPKGHVSFAAEPQTIAAGQPATLLLHFRVESGFHINSHTPKSEMLIPTKIVIEDMTGADVSAVDFPKGTEYSFAFEPKEKLDVYTGDLVLTAHIKAQSGSHTLKGALRYQACDNAACYPPKLLPLEQPFTAK